MRFNVMREPTVLVSPHPAVHRSAVREAGPC